MSRKPQGMEVSADEILSVAHKHFTKSGFYGVNLKEIASEMGITRTPIYYYFSSKLGLYEAVTKKHLLDKLAQYNEIFSSNLPFFEKMRQDFKTSTRLRMSEQQLFAGIDTSPQLAGVSQHRSHTLRDIHAIKTDGIKKAIDDKILRPDTDPEQFMGYFYIVSFGIEAIDKQTEYDITDERIERLIDTLLDGIIHKYKAD